MTTRRPSPNMQPSRKRTSVEAPRHVPRTMPQAPHIYTTQMPILQSNYVLVPPAPEYFTELATYLPSGSEYFPGNDGSYIPTTVVAPTALSFQEAMTTSGDSDTSRSSSSGSIKSLSPPLTEAEMLLHDVYWQTSDVVGLDQYPHYSDPWVNVHGMPPTPPPDPSFDIPDMFNTGKNDHMAFPLLPESATECEYLGVSKLQFSSVLPRHAPPRTLRPASERSTSNSSCSGSPKDEATERTKNNPRNDPRYDIKADKSGQYHCPYAREGCTHKPTKQKCIYAKNLDSHLKPYTCKFGVVDENCRNQRFSSNACLFRHEREMHGLHNHGINPYLCLFKGCERARADNGFPRRWNQRDHMKRVHGWEEPENDDAADGGPNDIARRRKGPGASTSVPMKRTSSARAHPYLPSGQPRMSAPRYTAQMQRELQAQRIMVPGMVVKNQYTQHPMVTQSYGPGMYMQAPY